MNGGSERVFLQERDFFQQRHISVIDFSMQDPRNFESEYSDYFVPHIDYHEHGGGMVQRLKAALSFIHSRDAVKRLSVLLAKYRPDVVHMHNIYHQITPSIIPMIAEKGIKSVLTIHDGKLVCPSYLMLNKGRICTSCREGDFYKALVSGCQDSLSKGILLCTEAYWHKWKSSYDSVDLFISPSQFMADLVATRISSSKVVVLRNGIDSDMYQPEYKPGDYALFLGRLSREKGIGTLLRAHSMLQGAIPLKVVGTGPLESELKEEFPGAEILGYKTGSGLAELTKNAAFVVVPSEWYENCSMVVLEAMAFGKPVIASRIGGIPEQVQDGCNGLLFDAGNTEQLAEKIELLWSSPKVMEQMGKAGREKLERDFCLKKHCQNLLSLYEHLIK